MRASVEPDDRLAHQPSRVPRPQGLAERAPASEIEGDGEQGQGALAQAFTEYFGGRNEEGFHPKLDHLSGEGMIFGVAKDAGRLLGVTLVPTIEGLEAVAQPFLAGG